MVGNQNHPQKGHSCVSNITVIMGALPTSGPGSLPGRADGSRFQAHSPQVGSGPIQVPQRRSVPTGVVGFGQVGVDVFHRRLELIERIPEFDQGVSGQEDVVGSEAVGGRQMPRFKSSLAMATPAIDLGTAGPQRNPERRPTPETYTNSG